MLIFIKVSLNCDKINKQQQVVICTFHSELAAEMLILHHSHINTMHEDTQRDRLKQVTGKPARPGGP